MADDAVENQSLENQSEASDGQNKPSPDDIRDSVKDFGDLSRTETSKAKLRYQQSEGGKIPEGADWSDASRLVYGLLHMDIVEEKDTLEAPGARDKESDGLTSLRADTGHIDAIASPLDQRLGRAVDHSPAALTAEMARLTRNRAEFDLKAAHKNLKFTNSGAPPAVISYEENVRQSEEKTVEQIADQRLGADATTEQKRAYIQALQAANFGKITVDVTGKTTVSAGTELNLPGQEADGSIVYRRLFGDGTIKSWNDSSSIAIGNDGDGEAHYKVGDRDIAVTWDSQNLERNRKTDSKWIEINANTHEGYVERIESSYDKKGRTVESTFGKNAQVADSIKITDKSSNIIELTRGTDGELHGKKTNHGKVVDADVGMRKDGRIFSKTTDKDGNVTRQYEEDDKKRHIRQIFSPGKKTPDSTIIVDKDSNVTELNDKFIGTKRAVNGEIVDVGLATDGEIFTITKETNGDTTHTFNDKHRQTYDRNGNLIRMTITDDKGRSEESRYRAGEKEPESFIITDTDKSVIEVTLGKDGEYHGAKKDASGNVVDGDVGRGDIGIYSRKRDGQFTIKNYEQGYTEKFDEKGNLVHTEGKDEAGRLHSTDYHPGEKKPYRCSLTLHTGENPTEFKRATDGNFVADYRLPSGETVGTIQFMEPLLYDNQKEHIRTAVYADGRSVSKQTLASGETRIDTVKNGEFRSSILDAQGRVISDTFYDKAAGTIIILASKYDQAKETSEELSICKDGKVLHLTKDAESGDYIGYSAAYSGSPEDLQKVRYTDGKLIYTDVRSGAVTSAESVTIDDKRVGMHFSPVEYDSNCGTVTTDPGPPKRLESFAPGRVDLVNSDGSRSYTTLTGDVASQQTSGESSVVHADGTGVNLKPDGTIISWDKTSTNIEQISQVESDFLKSNPDIDRRDFAEIHRRLEGNQKKIDDFYKELGRIDQSDQLSAAEKVALKTNLMHHVASPAEIYQGKASTCNVAVLQRDLAMTDPAKYASFVTSAVGYGEYVQGDGTAACFDVNNLKMQDTSGRDLASRVFQTAALDMLRFPKAGFLNTDSGVGEFRTLDGDARRYGNRQTFDGINIIEIAKIRYQITGQSQNIVAVKSIDDLAALYKCNGGRPMTIAVNGALAPFSGAGPVGAGDSGGHVVTITSIDEGPPMKFYIQNQWGLEEDHSTVETAIDANDLWNNMSATTDKGETRALAIAVTPRRDVAYRMNRKSDGTIELEPIFRIFEKSDGSLSATDKDMVVD